MKRLICIMIALTLVLSGCNKDDNVDAKDNASVDVAEEKIVKVVEPVSASDEGSINDTKEKNVTAFLDYEAWLKEEGHTEAALRVHALAIYALKADLANSIHGSNNHIDDIGELLDITGGRMESYFSKKSLEEEEINYFDSHSETFKSDNNDYTSLYDNGSIITEYSDGSVVAIDYLGNRYLTAVDGTFTVYLTNGNVIREYTDGSQAMEYPCGRKETIYPDGTFETLYRSGLCNRYVPGKMVSYFFPDGEGELVEHGNIFPFGSVSGPNGETLINGENGLTLITKNKDEYTYSLDENGNPIISMKFADGSTLLTSSNGAVSFTPQDKALACDSGGNTLFSVDDGTIISFTSGGGLEMRNPDGSFFSIKRGTDLCEILDNESGFSMKAGDDGVIESLHLNGNGKSAEIQDGVLTSLIDDNKGYRYDKHEMALTVR